LLSGYNKPLLLHTIERIKKSQLIKDVIVATTNKKIDDIICQICQKYKISFFRGSSDDVLSRYFHCAKKFKTDVIVRITSDCPLIDPLLIDKIIEIFMKKNKDIDYLSNLHPATFPDGFDIEVFNYLSLKRSYMKAKKKFQREHVTPYIWDNKNIFNIDNFKLNNRNYQNTHRLTLDYLDDYKLIWLIYKKLYPQKKFFDLSDILKFLKKNPNLLRINKKYIKFNWYSKYLNHLKTIKKNETKSI
jgi:spore coat polysaccharide biosynthesis protein SpsF